MLLSPVGPLPYAAFVPLFYSTPRGMVLASWIPLACSGDGLTARWTVKCRRQHVLISTSGNRFYDFSHTNNDFLYTRRRRAHRYQRVDCHYYVFFLFSLFGGTRVQIIHQSWKVHTVLHLMILHTCGAQSTHLRCSTQGCCLGRVAVGRL